HTSFSRDWSSDVCSSDLGSTATSILRAMVERYVQEEANLGLESRAKELGLTPHQVMTVASLLEAEARTKDFPKVARVVYNRVKQIGRAPCRAGRYMTVQT